MKTHRASHTMFFDLGNVLIFFSLEKMVKQLSECTHIPPHVFSDDVLFKEELMPKYEMGRLTSDELYRVLQSKSPHSFSFQEMTMALSDIFTPNTELWPVVRKLKEQGTRLVLISNTNECHFNYAYAHFPILKLFDRFILSYEVGACKPSSLIYEKALRQAEGKSFYTDDIPAFIEAGRSAGLDAEVYTDVSSLKKHLKTRGFLPS